MERLPVEVVGIILTRLGAARDVVIASATSRTYRDAFRNHLRSLVFNSNDWPVYHELTTGRLEILITETILQTNGLQCLSVIMDHVDQFIAAPVAAWLMYTRDTLRMLHYNVKTLPSINILEKCGRQRLEVLKLAHNAIVGVETIYHRFPCLRVLALSYVSISALDMRLLLKACPKIEILMLVSLDIAMSDPQAFMHLASLSLKEIYVEAISLDTFIIEAESLKKLHLKDCTLEEFVVVGKGALEHLRIDNVSVIDLDIGDSAENLEVVDVSSFTIRWSKFHQMISKSSKLRSLRLWCVVFDDENESVDVEMISSCFPLLNHLSLSYDLKEAAAQYSLQGSFQMEHVRKLELGWTEINYLFSEFVAGLVERCPNLQNLIIYGAVSETKTYKECHDLANFTSFIVMLMRKYMHIDFQFIHV